MYTYNVGFLFPFQPFWTHTARLLHYAGSVESRIPTFCNGAALLRQLPRGLRYLRNNFLRWFNVFPEIEGVLKQRLPAVQNTNSHTAQYPLCAASCFSLVLSTTMSSPTKNNFSRATGVLPSQRCRFYSQAEQQCGESRVPHVPYVAKVVYPEFIISLAKPHQNMPVPPEELKRLHPNK